MCSFIPNRKATDEDIEKLERMARRFYKNHKLGRYQIDPDYDAITAFIEMLERGFVTLSDVDEKKLIHFWKQCVIRTIGDEQIAWGYVGHSVKN